jgi:two-component system sensor histidine kinase DegS
MSEAVEETELNPLEAFMERSAEELEKSQNKLKEIALLVEQSQGEVDKLAQRNASITAQLHQLQAHFDTVPREDIRGAYESAQDAQQRLFTMRGQLEKLQSDKSHLERYVQYINELIALIEGGSVPTPGATPAPRVQSGVEQIIEAQEEERRKISRQIHDGPAQALANFILQTEIATRLFDADPDKARDELNSLKSSASTTFNTVRGFIFDLRPMMLDDLGVVPTVRRYTEAFKEKTGLNINLVVTGTERRLESHREVLVFRAVQQLLGNVRDYAQATQAKVTLDMGDHQVRAGVEDNGKGFEVDELDTGDGQGQGLEMLRKRVEQVGGVMEIDSSADQGSRVIFWIPTGD